MEIFNNAWVVGIGGGILSGFIVFFITRFFLSKREDKEYLQKINSVNREIITSIKPGLSESVVPHEDVIEALINSTSTKYGVDKKDVYELENIVDDLVKEVMDSSFISASDKEDFCDKILQLKRQKVDNIDNEYSRKSKNSQSISEYKKRINQYFSFALAIISTTMVVLTTFVFDKISFLQDGLSIELIPIIVGATPVLVFMLIYVLKDFIKMLDQRRKLTSEQRIDDKNDSSEASTKKTSVKIHGSQK